MSKNMLIDSAHSEEIRVAIVDGEKLDRFDFETPSKTQIKGYAHIAPGFQGVFVALVEHVVNAGDKARLFGQLIIAGQAAGKIRARLFVEDAVVVGGQVTAV